MIPVFDGHNDAITRDDYQDFVTGRPDGHLDLPRMRAGGIRGAIFAVFTQSPGDDDAHTVITRPDGSRQWPEAEPVEHPVAAAFATRAAGRLLAVERAGHVRLVRQIGDLDAAAADNNSPPGVILHLEGAEAIDPGLESLEFWYAAGLRSLGPVWSRSNAFGHGVPFLFGSGPDTGPGLTDAGNALVRRCAELGIVIDLSHLNEAGFWDVAALEPGPLVASHSGAYSLARTSRNLTDAQIDAIGASGGLIGIVYAVAFLRSDFADDPETPLSLIARHAAYVAERVGVEHVGLGSDFDGTMIPASLKDAAGVPRLLDALRDVGFTTSEVESIAWGNWRRVLDAWWR